MSILAWIILGLIAGFIGSKLVNKTGEGVVLDTFSASWARSLADHLPCVRRIRCDRP